MEKFWRGEKIRFYCEVRDVTGTLYDPTSVAVNVYDEKSVAVVSASALSKDSQGIYSGSATSGATWMRGHYNVLFKVTAGTDLIYDEDEFQLEVLPE